MPDLTPERLREIEASSWADSEDVQLLISALKQAREERDQYAAALAYARHDIANCFVACAHCDRSFPAECLKARDAEKDRQIALLTKTIDSLATYEPLPGTPKRQADSQEKAV